MNDKHVVDNSTIIEVNNISRTYAAGPEVVTVWSDISFSVGASESISIVGASGSGKTTLLNAIGGLDSVDSGTVLVGGESIYEMSEKRRTTMRNHMMGFVYQFHHLLPEFSAQENVAMPLRLSGASHHDAMEKAAYFLDLLGLGNRLSHRPAELSGGERQRAAIARATVNDPKIVLMDEPTGNLDNAASYAVERLIDQLREQLATAFILVTHDTDLAKRMDRQYQLVNNTLELCAC